MNPEVKNIDPRLTYIYAQVKQSTRECKGVVTSTNPMVSDSFYEYVRLDHYDLSYKNKYYINGAWYEDAAGTIPWSPST